MMWGEEGTGEPQLPRAVEVEELAQGKQCRCCLSDDGCGCRPSDAEGNDDQQQNIECDVERDGGGKIVQSTCRIAEGAQDRTCRVVEQLCEYAEKRDTQVEDCRRDEIGGGGERREQLLSQDNTRRCKEYRECDDGDEDTLYERTQTCILLFSLEMGDEDAEPRREPDEEIDDDGEDEARRTDGGKCLCTEHLSDERRVRDGVELLQQL